MILVYILIHTFWIQTIECVFHCLYSFFILEVEMFREWLRYRYGVFPESGFEGDRIYPSKYDFGGETRDSSGCKNIASRSSNENGPIVNSKYDTSEYQYKISQSGSHVTVPFLPRDESNGDDEPNLKLEEFSPSSFQVNLHDLNDNMYRSTHLIFDI